MPKGERISYSDEELGWIEAHKSMIRREAHSLFVEKFGREDVSLANYHSLCKRRGWLTGRTGQFERGHETHNKGMKGFYAPGSEKGWFKRGERRGVAVRLYQPVGTERVSKDGYLERKVNDDLPLQKRWRAVHLINWEAVNGPIPAGHALKCLDGDKQNTDPTNWTLVSRSMLPRLAGAKKGVHYDSAPNALKPTLLGIARLEQAAREAKK